MGRASRQEGLREALTGLTTFVGYKAFEQAAAQQYHDAKANLGFHNHQDSTFLGSIRAEIACVTREREE